MMKDQVLRLLPAAANGDGEFALAARMWDADVVLVSGADAVRLRIRAGRIDDVAPVAVDAPAPDGALRHGVRIVGPADGWSKMLMSVPPPFYQDLFGAAAHHGFAIQGAIEDVGPYYPGLRRLIELLRQNGAS